LPIKQQLRVNDKIRAKEVRLIDAKGEQLGLVPVEQAIERAARDNLDLVEVAPDATPPVCKIMDYRRYTFEQKRRLKESKKKTKSLEMKEIKLRPNIDPHDYEIKLRHTRDFLDKGHKVKVTMRFRAREMRHVEIGTQVLTKMKGDLKEIAEPDAIGSGREGARAQVMVLAPKKKK
jgi:translation initiation factor IF-3